MFHGASETIRDLAAFRESNVVPIKSFYAPEYRRNIFATMVHDSNPNVRIEFYRQLYSWRTTLPERLDYGTYSRLSCN